MFSKKNGSMSLHLLSGNCLKKKVPQKLLSTTVLDIDMSIYTSKVKLTTNYQIIILNTCYLIKFDFYLIEL